jgi:hypothetical protein
MIYVHFDLSEILDLVNIKEKVEAAAKDAIRDLSAQAHAHLIEQVQSKLHSTRQKYLDALSIQQVDDNTWLINLDSKAMWIEEGIEANKEMIDDLLKSPKAKTAKDGSKYAVIPFQHNKGPTSQTPAQKSLTDTVKEEFKRRKIPYGKVETDGAGNPKKGLLHSFDIRHAPLKTANKPGQGKGPIGSVMQGPTGIPFLKGIRVYQKETKDHAGNVKIQKAIMTFRVVSSKHKGTGRWVHPGLDPKKFLDETADWALRQWEDKVKQKVLESIEKAI